jgi:serine/threonine protein kinase/Tol biopolymer transport system component
MPLATGVKLEGYEVLSLLGAGGMGEVYRARDPVLKREVAIKVLPSFFLRDPERLRRFEKEAQAAAALNHPNILAIYRFGVFNGAPFLVSELLVGETLRQQLARGPLPVRKAIETGVQIAHGLAAAHEKGIVHRDLKPENLFVTRDGRVKILDFGLAKLIEPHAGLDAMSSTVSHVTEPGVVMGSIGYMSPEQGRGNSVDQRTDIFAFGAILYEMLAGKRAFQRPTPAETMAAILNEDPPELTQFAPAISPGLQRIVHRCMEKVPEQRFQSASDLAFALEALSESGIPSGGANGAADRRMPKRVPNGLIAMSSLIIVAIVAFALVGLATIVKPSPASNLLDSTQITFSADPKQGPVFTDGSRLYFGNDGQPSEMSITGGPIVPTQILGQGMQILDISRDGSNVVGLKLDLNDNVGRGTLWTAPMLGGAARKLSDHLAFKARWSPDGRSILFCDQRTLYTIDVDGENLRTVWTGPGNLDDMSFSPDGQKLSLSVSDTHSVHRLWALLADGRNAHPLQFDWPANASQYAGQWTPDGRRFLFTSDREGPTNVYELVAPRWFEFWKKPAAVRLTGNPLSIQAFTPARDGNSVYVLGLMDEGTMRAYDPHSRKMMPYLDNLSMLALAISPDGHWMAYLDYPSRHLWKSRLDGSEKLQLTNSYAGMVQWSPDGKWLAYSDFRNLYRVSADGGAPEKLTPDGHDDVQPSWFPDGKKIAFNYFPYPDQPLRIRVLDLATRQISTMPGADGYFFPLWSPDGKYLAAIAENPSRMELYSAETAKWKDLHTFEAPWGWVVWAKDSKSVYMSYQLGKNGIYNLTVPDGRWTKLSGLEGVNPTDSDSYLSLTPEGQPAMMSRTGVAQLYLLHWNR